MRTFPLPILVFVTLLLAGERPALAVDGDLIASQIDVTPGGAAASDFAGDALAFLPGAGASGADMLAVGRPGATGGATAEGVVDLLTLGAGGSATATFTIADTMSGDPDGLITLAFDDAFGTSIATLGDLDGLADGRTDIAVGAMDSDGNGFSSGSVWILSLEADSGIPRAAVELAHDTNGLGPLSSGDRFGSAVASLGDWDGDGVPDVAVGAMGDDVGSPGQGSIYILYMNANGTVRHSVRINGSEGGFGGTIGQDQNFGSAIALIGDQNADGLPDLAVGASGAGLSGLPGSVWLLQMSPSCFVNTAAPACAVLAESEITEGTTGIDGSIGGSARFGESIAWVPAASALDVDRLVIGAPEFGADDAGTLWLVELSEGVLSGSKRIGDELGWSVDLVNSSQFGAGLTGIGDVDADGVSDYAFGARGGFSLAGQVFTAIAETCPSLILRPIVYHDPTDVGQDPCRPVALPATNPLYLNLWLESAGVSSSPLAVCDAAGGGGTEMCAWDVRVALDGAYSMLDFDLDTLLLSQGVMSSDPGLMPDELRLNWVKTGTLVAQNGKVRLGRLTLANDGSGPGSVRVAAGSAAVGPALQLQTIGLRTLGVPEPGFVVGLVAGALALVGARGRRRRPSTAAATLGLALLGVAVTAGGASAQSILNQIRISEGESLFPPNASGFTNLGASIATPGDVDTDGTIDLAFGCCATVGQPGAERIFIEWLTDRGVPAAAPGTVAGYGGDLYARALEGIPDRDGDGIPELLVGTPTTGQQARADQVSMVFLNLDGSRKADRVQYGPGLPGGFGATLGPGNDEFGEAIAWLGNANGDPTTDEFVVGAPNDSNVSGTDAGSVWIVSINASNQVVREQEILPGDVSLADVDEFGQALAAIGDLDDNGVRDLAIGASRCDALGYGCVTILALGPDGVGGVQILASTVLGNGTGGLPSPLPTQFGVDDLAWINDVPNLNGGVLAVGEDGTADNVYMIHVQGNGVARDFYRIFDGAGVGESLNAPWSDSGFGASVGGPGDVNGDGVADLVVGAVAAQRFGGGAGSGSEGAVHVFHLIDSDFDGLDDVLDNCAGSTNIDPTLSYNPVQLDADGDGVGDVCDICPDDFDPLQTDADADGEGDACEPVQILLQPTGTTQTPSWDLLIECGAYDVTAVNVGLVPPTGATNPKFDYVCPAPPVGGQCATVDPALSTESGPGLVAPAGVRADAVYVQAVGEAPSGTLCMALDPPSKIGELGTDFIPSASAVAAAALTEEGVGVPGFALALAADGSGPIPLTDIALVTGDPIARATIRLGPAVAAAGGTRWDVLLDASDLADRFHRVAFGLVAPIGTELADMRFIGCDNATGEAGAVRICGAGMAPTINPAMSWTLGPADPIDTPPGLHPHTMYVVLEGNVSYFLDLTRPYINLPPSVTTLGTVELTGTPDLEPALILEGVDLIEDRFGGGTIDPFERSVVGSLADLDEVRLIGQFNPAEDADGDGIQDLADNCPYGQNSDQFDRGGFQSTEPDRRGDVCQCGDASRDGIVDELPLPVDDPEDDLLNIRKLLIGEIEVPAIVADVEARCSVSSGVGCDIRDLVLLQQAIDTATPPETRCDAALSPGPGS